MEGHFSTCDPVGPQVKKGVTCWKFSVACIHRLMLSWKKGPLISHEGPFQGSGSSSGTVYAELQRHHFSCDQG